MQLYEEPVPTKSANSASNQKQAQVDISQFLCFRRAFVNCDGCGVTTTVHAIVLCGMEVKKVSLRKQNLH